jgi:hypothetical protein
MRCDARVLRPGASLLLEHSRRRIRACFGDELGLVDCFDSATSPTHHHDAS